MTCRDIFGQYEGYIRTDLIGAMKANLYSVDLFKQILDLLSEYGVPSEAFLALPELQDIFDDAETQTSGIENGQVLLSAVNITGDPQFGLRLGQKAKISDFGSLGFAAMSCINLREVLHLIVRYHPVLNLGPKWDLMKTAHGMILRTSTSLNQAAGHRLMMETTFSTLYVIGESLLGGPINQVELQLNYPAPSHADAYKNYFAMPVKFGQEKCQALLLDDDLDRTLRTANPAGNVVFREQCEVMLRGLNQVDNISAAIRRLLIHAGREFPDIDTVARHLGIGERTLRRRLKSENSSFRTICDEVRNVLACRYLSSTQITVAEIAYLLGCLLYTSPSPRDQRGSRMPSSA